MILELDDYSVESEIKNKKIKELDPSLGFETDI